MVKFTILGTGSRAPGVIKRLINPGNRGWGGGCCLSEIMIRATKRDEGPVLWAIPKWYPILKQHLVTCHMFSA